MPHTTGICFQVQRFSIHDGPGIRTTVFLKGCPLSCSWCHNPEGRSGLPEIHLFPERCIACGDCLDVCPNPIDGGAGPEGVSAASLLAAARPGCIQCGLCADVCPSEARRLVGRTVAVSELLDEVERDRPFYEESGGGVTFSGGEPLIQGPFLMKCLDACRERGLQATVDTCGYAATDFIREVARRADLILFDLKLLDERRHQAETGVPLAPILANLAAIDTEEVEVWVRVPLIPGINDDDRNIDAIGRHVSSLSRIRRIHLLPYHRGATAKYERIRMPSRSSEIDPPGDEEIERIRMRLSAFDLDVRKGG